MVLDATRVAHAAGRNDYRSLFDLVDCFAFVHTLHDMKVFVFEQLGFVHRNVLQLGGVFDENLRRFAS